MHVCRWLGGWRLLVLGKVAAVVSLVLLMVFINVRQYLYTYIYSYIDISHK